MSNIEKLTELGPEWHEALIRFVERSVCGWLLCGNSRMWQDDLLFGMHSRAMSVLNGPGFDVCTTHG